MAQSMEVSDSLQGCVLSHFNLENPASETAKFIFKTLLSPQVSSVHILAPC